MTETCPCCGQPMPGTTPTPQLGLSLDEVIARCEALGIKIIPEGMVYEADAAKLLNYRGADALRKQVYERKNFLRFRKIGVNRRAYFLEEIRLHL